MAEMSTLNGYEIVDDMVRSALGMSGTPSPMSTLMNGKYEIVDRKAREKLEELLAGDDGPLPVSSFAEPLCEYVREAANFNRSELYYTKDDHPYLMILFQEKKDGVDWESFIAIFSEIKDVTPDTNNAERLLVNFGGLGSFGAYNLEYHPTNFNDLVFIMNDLINSDYCKLENGVSGINTMRSKTGGTTGISLVSDVKIYTNFTTDIFDSYDNIEWIYFDGTYTLQDKTITTNGEVIPDEGYYGLSKVTVNVSGGEVMSSFAEPLYEDFMTALRDHHDKDIDEDFDHLMFAFYQNNDGTYGNWIMVTRTAASAQLINGVLVIETGPYYDSETGITIDDYYDFASIRDQIIERGFYYFTAGSGTSSTATKNTRFSGTIRIYTNFMTDIFDGLEGVEWLYFDDAYSLQSKTVTENGEVVPDAGYYGLSKVTVDVPISNSVPGGYMVNFFNTDNELIQTHSAKYGYSVDTPISYGYEWVNSKYELVTFPIIITEDSGTEVLNVYPILSDWITMESGIYDHFGISKSSYEWVVVRVDIPNKTVAAYFVPAPTAPGNLYDNGVYSGHIFSGNMRSAAQVYTVTNVETGNHPVNNLELLFHGEAAYSTMSSLNIPFTRDGTVLLYANYMNEAINLNLVNSKMPADL